MDIELRNILKSHKEIYPMMELDDVLKLIYQQTFGPNHFSKKIDHVHALSYLIKEFETFTYYPKTPIIEFIGNNYYRISLETIHRGDLTIFELTEMFLKSMEKIVLITDTIKQSFLKNIDELIIMIEQNELDYHVSDSIRNIQDYIKSGINPRHHSDVYRSLYHPFYRVVHLDFISERLMSKYT